jgi:hypothetical protein
MTCEEPAKIGALDARHDGEEECSAGAHEVDGNNIGVAEIGQYYSLALKAVDCVLVCGNKYFNGEISLKWKIAHSVDNAERPRSQPVLDGIVWAESDLQTLSLVRVCSD